ncbi:MAG: hypothetical protein ACTSYD_06855, partial [Candidatus Heimdallarchaeaceae archaeon]
ILVVTLTIDSKVFGRLWQKLPSTLLRPNRRFYADSAYWFGVKISSFSLNSLFHQYLIVCLLPSLILFTALSSVITISCSSNTPNKRKKIFGHAYPCAIKVILITLDDLRAKMS